jgi:hypothetical protein
VNACRLLEIVADGGEGGIFIPVYFVGPDFKGDGVNFIHDEWFSSRLRCRIYNIRILPLGFCTVDGLALRIKEGLNPVRGFSKTHTF